MKLLFTILLLTTSALAQHPQGDWPPQQPVHKHHRITWRRVGEVAAVSVMGALVYSAAHPSTSTALPPSGVHAIGPEKPTGGAR